MGPANRTVHVRVDNRLLHGQVVQFWLPRLGARHLIVADDAVAADEAMPTIFRMALPDTVKLTVTPVSRLAAELAQTRAASVMVLLREVHDAARFLMCGGSLTRLTLGNIHAAPDRARVTDSIYLSAAETEALVQMAARGVEIEIQTFPGEVLRFVVDDRGEADWSRR